MNPMKRLLPGLLALGGLCVCAAVPAGTICVDPGHQPTTLQQALQTWANASGAATVIKVAGGTYPLSVSLQQLIEPASPLTLLGGYAPNTNCDDGQRDIATHATILDGGGNGVFALQPDATTVIDGLEFDNFYGATTSLSGAPEQGIFIYTVLSDVTISRVHAHRAESVHVFNNNGAPNLSLLDCLVENQPVDATVPALRLGAENAHVVLRNCTISGNAGGGVQMDSYDGGQVDVYNTISFSNGGPDFFVGNPGNTPNVYFSLYESGSGFTPYSSVIPVSNYTLFAGAGDYHLAQGSPAINAGDPNLSYPAGETDLGGNARVSGGRIDIGAYESNFVPNQYIVTSTSDSISSGTLRWALNQANAAPDAPATILFNLGPAAGCPYTISLASALPDIAGSVFIDGRSQPGWVANGTIGAFDGTLCVRVGNGASLGYALHTASTASASQVVALGLIFTGFSQAAVKLEGGGGHNIGDDWFGGPSLPGNHYGVQVSGNVSGAQIGGADAAFTNLIDNSGSVGIYLANAAGNNLVQNNVVGIAPDGTGAAGQPTGIFVSNSANNTLRANYVGYSTGTSSGAIVLYGPGAYGNVVQQNDIGWDFYGDLPNAGAGIVVSNGAHDNVIGSTYASVSFGNSVRNSAAPGVWITSIAGAGNSVTGNDLVSNGGPTWDNGLAIDLGATGPDANVASGPQNYPVLTHSFALGNQQLIAGTLDAAANTLYRIDFYHLPGAPLGVSGRGGAGLFDGFSAFATGANGHCSFLLTVPQLQVDGWMSAAATELYGNTSEIGNAVAEQTDAVFLDGFGGVNACQ